MKWLVSFVILISLTGCRSEKTPHIGAIWVDYKARLDIERERYEEALLKYYEMIALQADLIRAHSNIGVLLNLLQKPDEAEKSLIYALSLAQQQQDVQAEFNILFNLGVHFAKQKNISLALQNYQAALEIVPTSTEVKTNIELLMQDQQQDKNGDGEKDQQQSENGSGQQNQQDQQQGQDQNKDQSKQDKPSESEGEQNKQNQPEESKSERETSARYKPRPYQGEQLSEGDVKKILGELRNQEQKIRANFDKKDKGKSSSNEKDW